MAGRGISGCEWSTWLNSSPIRSSLLCTIPSKSGANGAPLQAGGERFF
jgi:hypothetical protein